MPYLDSFVMHADVFMTFHPLQCSTTSGEARKLIFLLNVPLRKAEREMSWRSYGADLDAGTS